MARDDKKRTGVIQCYGKQSCEEAKVFLFQTREWRHEVNARGRLVDKNPPATVVYVGSVPLCIIA